ncbi:tRNA dihydrouridine synthase DusB [Acidiferrobacter sp.]|uniref:tRNA dihydrouridine synthase DusB n=1 Tax=Acidiferrobacter sp. TaxID=1872107 RepID=UPI00260386C9|nr:tRNA dihydrouridine synthase DusB [Acidiferrobacter sp.]
MQIGPYTLKNTLFVAPMAGVTDRPFRILCRTLGAGMAVSEMVTSQSLLYGSEKTRRRADHEGEPEPKSVQIAGADPVLLACAARHNVAHGAQIIDINMGCPAKKVCNVMAGSALLRDPALIARLLTAVVSAVDVPVTLKIRTGWDRDHRNGVEIARLAESCGVALLAVHGRTRSCFFEGEAEYETIAAIKAAVRIPVIANGDIDSPEKARAVLDATGADGLMIGRAAQGRPWIFREIDHYLKTGEKLAPPSRAELYAILMGHLEALYAFYGEHTGVRVARKHIGWYSKGLANGAGFRRAVNQAGTIADQRRLLEDFFGQASAELAA